MTPAEPLRTSWVTGSVTLKPAAETWSVIAHTSWGSALATSFPIGTSVWKVPRP
jgi:hypothetical protein